MLSVSQSVEKVVMSKPFVMEALIEGLLNISSLARQITPAVEKLTGKTVKQGAIVMALNRMIVSLEGKSMLSDLTHTISDIIVRSNLTDYTFRNSSTILKSHINLMSCVSSLHDVFYTMVRGVFESNLIVSSDLNATVEREFSAEECTHKNDNLSAITLKLPEGNDQAVGFYYQILKMIAYEGINVKEVVSTTNEFSIIVSEEDIEEGFRILKGLKNRV